MQQVKIFTGLEGHTGDLESEINQWVSESNATIIQIIGNIAPQAVLSSGESHKSIGGGSARRYAPSDILVIVLYE